MLDIGLPGIQRLQLDALPNSSAWQSR